MQKLPPIPMPLGTRWREFRYRYMPIITFSVLVLIVAHMWKNYVTPPNVLAVVEPVTVRIMSPQPGTLAFLEVEQYQRVTNGQIIAVVDLSTTNSYEANLAVLKADLEATKAGLSVGELRNEQNYTRELLRFQAERAELEINRVEAAKALVDYLRISNLFHQKPPVETEEKFDLARYTYFALATNVAVNTQRLAEKERLLPTLLGTNVSAIDSALERDLNAKIMLLRDTQRLVLRSPIDGCVSLISNRVGETVLRGQPIATITSTEGHSIIAYARQPLNDLPQVGDEVTVRKQTFRRQVASAKVTQVGTQLELIDRSLLVNVAANKSYEMGLPFKVSMPDSKDFPLAPGERVDVVVLHRKTVGR